NLSQEKVNRLVVVTDGDCQDPKEALEACEIEREAGISFSTLSLGDGEHSLFLAELARTGNGKCYPNIESNHLPEIFSQELMSARPTFTTQVEFFLHVEAGWNVSRVFKISPVIMDLGGKFADTKSFSIKLSDLQLHDDQVLLLELTPTAVNRANQT